MTGNRSLTSLCALVVFMPCCSLALIADAMIYPALAGGFLLIAVVNPHPLVASTRALVYSVTIAALFAYIINLTLPLDSERFFFPFIEYLFPFVICLAVCLTFLQASQVRLSLIITLAVLAMMIEGSCITNPQDSPLAAFGPLWRNRFWIYGVFVSAQAASLLPLLLLIQRIGMTRTAAPKPPKSKRLVYLYSLALLSAFTVAGTQLTLHAERVLEPTFRRIFDFYLEMYRPRVVFGGEVDLNRKNSPFVTVQGDRIMLRAISEQVPGYLRGRVYETYDGGKWSGIERDLKLVAGQDEDLASTRFVRHPHGEDGSAIDIYPSRRFYSDVLLATGNAHSIELIADSITSNRNGELLPQSWDRGGAYTLFVPAQDRAQSYPKPDIHDDATLYLTVPEQLALPLETYATLNFPAALHPEQRVRAMETHLQSVCAYELGVELPGERDPVLEFLFDVRRGHCELYATTAVMLLRSQGIPARYVSGFACMERHPLQNCYISRVGDCHAWAEAWLADQQRWVLVEATPPSGLPDTGSRSSFLSRLFEMPRTAWQKLYTQIKRGHFAVAILAFFADFADIFAQLFWRGPWYIGWGSLALIATLFWAWWRRRHPPETALIREFHILLRELEARLHTLGVKRPPNATVATLANSARELRTPQSERVADLLLRYQALRFRPEAPAGEELELLRNAMGDLHY